MDSKVQKVVSGASRTSSTYLSRYCGYFSVCNILFLLTQHKAILSQFANKLGDTETPAAPKSKKMRTMAKRWTCTWSTATSAQGTGKIVTTSQTQSTDSDSGNGGGGFSADDDDDDNDGDNDNDDGDNDNDDDGDDDEHNNVTTIDDVNPLDTLDQDNDVIQAAEEAQQEDLNEAAHLANLEIMVTNGEREAASMALSKVSSVTSYWDYLLIIPDSSQDLCIRSTTHPASLKRWGHCARLLRSSLCTWSSLSKLDGIQNLWWSRTQSTSNQRLKISAAKEASLCSTKHIPSSLSKKNGSSLMSSCCS